MEFKPFYVKIENINQIIDLFIRLEVDAAQIVDKGLFPKDAATSELKSLLLPVVFCEMGKRKVCQSIQDQILEELRK